MVSGCFKLVGLSEVLVAIVFAWLLLVTAWLLVVLELSVLVKLSMFSSSVLDILSMLVWTEVTAELFVFARLSILAKFSVLVLAEFFIIVEVFVLAVFSIFVRLSVFVGLDVFVARLLENDCVDEIEDVGTDAAM